MESSRGQGCGKRSDGLELVGLRQSVKLSAAQQVRVSAEAVAGKSIRQLLVLIGGSRRVAGAKPVGGR